MFYWNSKFDLDMLNDDNYGSAQTSGGICNIEKKCENVNCTNTVCANYIANKLVTAFKAILLRKENIGVFIDGTYHHCPCRYDNSNPDKSIFVQSETVFGALDKWYGDPTRQLVFVDESRWEAET
eukprot:Pgem_evm1s19349